MESWSVASTWSLRLGLKISAEEVGSIERSLQVCAEDSEKLNVSRQTPEALIARGRMFQLAALAYNNLLAKVEVEDRGANPDIFGEQTRSAIRTESTPVLLNASGLMSLPLASNPNEKQLQEIEQHNRAICDQVMTVTRFTPAGLVIERGTAEGRRFLAEKYPRACLLEDTESLAPGVPRYLLVYATSEGVLSGFQATQRVTSSPVSGSGSFDESVWQYLEFHF